VLLVIGDSDLLIPSSSEGPRLERAIPRCTLKVRPWPFLPAHCHLWLPLSSYSRLTAALCRQLERAAIASNDTWTASDPDGLASNTGAPLAAVAGGPQPCSPTGDRSEHCGHHARGGLLHSVSPDERPRGIAQACRCMELEDVSRVMLSRDSSTWYARVCMVVLI
jgi:hypothetical protein